MFSTLGQKDYSSYSEIWIYFGADGKKVAAANDEKSKVLEINGKNYSFDENGVMAPWWARSASISDAQRSNPTTLDGVKYFSGYDGV